MNFSDSCRCGRPAPPCAPACGFLMQQIVGSGRTQLRCERFSLPLCGVPDSLCPPLRVLDVCASGPCEEVGRSFCGCGASRAAGFPFRAQAAGRARPCAKSRFF